MASEDRARGAAIASGRRDAESRYRAVTGSLHAADALRDLEQSIDRTTQELNSLAQRQRSMTTVVTTVAQPTILSSELKHLVSTFGFGVYALTSDVPIETQRFLGNLAMEIDRIDARLFQNKLGYRPDLADSDLEYFLREDVGRICKKVAKPIVTSNKVRPGKAAMTSATAFAIGVLDSNGNVVNGNVRMLSRRYNSVLYDYSGTYTVEVYNARKHGKFPYLSPFSAVMNTNEVNQSLSLNLKNRESIVRGYYFEV